MSYIHLPPAVFLLENAVIKRDREKPTQQKVSGLEMLSSVS